MKYTWEFCNHCEVWMVLCPTCGNNCCNGSSGKHMRGVDCDCDDAYAHQRKYNKNMYQAKFPKNVLVTIEEQNESRK